MTELTPYSTSLSPQALDSYARVQEAAAQRVTAHATRSRRDLTALTPTFGVIGADFLAALSATMQSRAERLDSLAATHGRIGTHTTTAAIAYSDADADAADMQLRLP